MPNAHCVSGALEKTTPRRHGTQPFACVRWENGGKPRRKRSTFFVGESGGGKSQAAAKEQNKKGAVVCLLAFKITPPGPNFCSHPTRVNHSKRIHTNLVFSFRPRNKSPGLLITWNVLVPGIQLLIAIASCVCMDWMDRWGRRAWQL